MEENGGERKSPDLRQSSKIGADFGTSFAKKRSRSLSFSLDWDNIIKDGDEYAKSSKVSLADLITYDRDTVDFCTGSSYTGKWNSLGMSGYGVYTFPHGCRYEGLFEDGVFHGEGALIYPMGQKLEGVWDKGKLMNYRFSNVDGLEYSDNWNYCVMPDRRFHVSIREGLQPGGREFLTNQQPTRDIEPEFYDTGDGFYNPRTRSIFIARDPEDYALLQEDQKVAVDVESDADFWVKAVTVVPDERHTWIINNCRKGHDEPTGYRPDLYENWVTGRRRELEDLEQKCTHESTSFLSCNSAGDRRFSLPSPNVVTEKKSFDYGETEKKISLSSARNVRFH